LTSLLQILRGIFRRKQASPDCLAGQNLLSAGRPTEKGRADMTAFAVLTSAVRTGVFAGVVFGVSKRR
jgi:hypothetical protein